MARRVDYGALCAVIDEALGGAGWREVVERPAAKRWVRVSREAVGGEEVEDEVPTVRVKGGGGGVEFSVPAVSIDGIYHTYAVGRSSDLGEPGLLMCGARAVPGGDVRVGGTVEAWARLGAGKKECAACSEAVTWSLGLAVKQVLSEPSPEPGMVDTYREWNPATFTGFNATAGPFSRFHGSGYTMDVTGGVSTGVSAKPRAWTDERDYSAYPVEDIVRWAENGDGGCREYLARALPALEEAKRARREWSLTLEGKRSTFCHACWNKADECRGWAKCRERGE